VPGHFLVGSLPEFKKDALDFMKNAYAAYGGVVKIDLGPRSFYLISDPELVSPVMIKNKDIFVKVYDMAKPRGLALVMGNGLVNSKGELWQRQRRMMQPLFHRTNIAAMAGEIASHGKKMIQGGIASGSQTVDMMATLSDVTLSIVARTMFSNDSDKLHRLFKNDIEFLLGYAQSNFFHPFPMPRWIPSKRNLRFKNAMRQITTTIKDMIEERRKSVRREGDLLDILLQSRDEETGEAMSIQQIVDECFTIFGAGHETTATALTWAIYLIARHPEVEKRLFAEVNAVLQGRSTPSLDDLDNLPYTRAVLDETMRCFPSVVSLLRLIERDFEIDGYHLRKGVYSLVNIYNLHHHADYWDNPELFQPDRFLGANKEKIKRHSYIPFGIGERVCIGNHFALMEAMILLTQLIQNFHFEYMGAQDPKPRLAISLRPQGGLPMRLIARHSLASKEANKHCLVD